MKTTLFASLLLASTVLAVGAAVAQPFPFNEAEAAQAPTKGRILDHIGFDVKDLKAFIKTLEADNIKLDRPYTVNDIGVGIAFITDPWGTYIEINERPPQ
jgi:hypothetical protein